MKFIHSCLGVERDQRTNRFSFHSILCRDPLFREPTIVLIFSPTRNQRKSSLSRVKSVLFLSLIVGASPLWNGTTKPTKPCYIRDPQKRSTKYINILSFVRYTFFLSLMMNSTTNPEKENFTKQNQASNGRIT